MRTRCEWTTRGATPAAACKTASCRYGDGSSFGNLQRYVSEAVRNSVNIGDVLDHVQWDQMERFDITGTSQTDFMVGGNFDDILHGEGGDDFIFARTGGGDLDGGPGTDTLSAHYQSLTVPFVFDSQQEFQLAGGPFALRIAGFEAFGVNPDRLELHRSPNGTDSSSVLRSL